MASTWRHTIVLVDANALKTTLNMISEEDGADIGAEFASANAKNLVWSQNLDDITNANIYSRALTYLAAGSPSLPSHPSDVSREAAVVTYLTGSGELPKYYTLRVPDPIEALFIGGLVDVDLDYADLVAYVAQIAADFVVSDGEQIDTSINDGLADGWFRSVKKSSR